MRTTRTPWAGVLMSCGGSCLSSEDWSRLSGRFREVVRWLVDRESELDRLFVVLMPNWLRLFGVVLSLTILLRTGLLSRLLTGDEGLEGGLDDLVSWP